MHRLFWPSILLALLWPVCLHAGDLRHDVLFDIERNTNANIVRYEARVGADGKLVKKKPVDAYWIRLADEGQVQKLNWVQKTFAYGFHTRVNREGDSVELDMKADIGRLITVSLDGEKYRATARIEDSSSYVERIFIHAVGKGMKTHIDYIELHGIDVATGQSRYERLVP